MTTRIELIGKACAEPLYPVEDKQEWSCLGFVLWHLWLVFLFNCEWLNSWVIGDDENKQWLPWLPFVTFPWQSYNSHSTPWSIRGRDAFLTSNRKALLSQVRVERDLKQSPFFRVISITHNPTPKPSLQRLFFSFYLKARGLIPTPRFHRSPLC